MNKLRKLHTLTKIRLFQFRYWKKHVSGIVFRPINIAFFVGIAVTIVLVFINGDVLEFSRPEDASMFFSTASLVGGALAIIVTLNTLLLQNALEKLPGRNYQKFSNHAGLNFIYLLLAAITVSLFYCGISYIDISGSPRGNLLRIGLGLVTWALVLIFLYLQIVVRSTDPMRQVVGLADSIKKKIDQTEMLVSSYLRIIATNTTQDIVSEQNIRNQVRPRVDEVLTDLSDMAGLYSRFNERGDTQLALSCIQTISASGTYIFDKRKDSALAAPTDNPLSPKSDLSDVSLKIDEILLPVWEDALRGKDRETIRVVLKGYQSMVLSAIDVNHRNYQKENPLMSYSFGGLKNIIELGLQSKNTDAIFHSTEVLQMIAIHIYNNCGRNRLASQYYKQCLDLLNLMYTYAIINNELSILKVGLEANLYAFANAVLSETDDSTIREIAAEKFSKTLQLANASSNPALIAGDEVMIQENLIRMVFVLPKRVRAVDIARLVRRTKLFSDALVDATSKSNITFNLDFQRFFVLSGQKLVDILANHSGTLNDGLNTDIEEVIDQLLQIQHNSVVNYAYGNRADGGSEVYTEEISIIGIDVAKFKNNDLAIKFINNLMDTAEWLLEKANTGTGFDRQALNTARYAGLIASVAHTERQYVVSRHFKDRARTFEAKWLVKIFPGGVNPNTRYMPSPNAVRHLFDDLVWGHGTSGLPQFFETPEDKAISYITGDAINTLNNYVWRDLPKPQNLPSTPDRFDLF